MIIINIFAVLFVFLHAIRDTQIIKNITIDNAQLKKVYNKRWHKVRAIEVALVSLVIGILYVYPQSCGIYARPLDFFWIVLLILFWMLLLFNPLLNYFMGWSSAYYSDNSIIDLITNKYIPRSFVNVFLVFMIIIINIYFYNKP